MANINQISFEDAIKLKNLCLQILNMSKTENDKLSALILIPNFANSNAQKFTQNEAKEIWNSLGENFIQKLVYSAKNKPEIYLNIIINLFYSMLSSHDVTKSKLYIKCAAPLMLTILKKNEKHPEELFASIYTLSLSYEGHLALIENKAYETITQYFLLHTDSQYDASRNSLGLALKNLQKNISNGVKISVIFSIFHSKVISAKGLEKFYLMSSFAEILSYMSPVICQQLSFQRKYVILFLNELFELLQNKLDNERQQPLLNVICQTVSLFRFEDLSSDTCQMSEIITYDRFLKFILLTLNIFSISVGIHFYNFSQLNTNINWTPLMPCFKFSEKIINFLENEEEEDCSILIKSEDWYEFILKTIDKFEEIILILFDILKLTQNEKKIDLFTLPYMEMLTLICYFLQSTDLNKHLVSFSEIFHLFFSQIILNKTKFEKFKLNLTYEKISNLTEKEIILNENCDLINFDNLELILKLELTPFLQNKEFINNTNCCDFIFTLIYYYLIFTNKNNNNLIHFEHKQIIFEYLVEIFQMLKNDNSQLLLIIKEILDSH